MQKIFFKKTLVIVLILLISSILSPLLNAYNLSQKTILNNNDNQIGYYTLFPTDDALIRETTPDDNFGSTIQLNFRSFQGGRNWQNLIKFDLSQIPSNVEIASAKMYLYYYTWKDNNPGGDIISLYRTLEDWNEDSVTWNNQPSVEAESSCQSIVPSTAGNWMTWDVTKDVVNFISGDEYNFGWLLKDDTYWGGVDIPIGRFYSKDYGEFSPYLEIIEFSKALVIGKIQNLDATGDIIKANVYNLRCLSFSPFGIHHFLSGEPILIDKSSKIGILTPSYICGFFNIAI